METAEPRRPRKDVQAKNIPDSAVLALMHTGVVSTVDLQELLAYPPKVVIAKLRALVRRGLLVSSGPAADELTFGLTEAGAEALAALVRIPGAPPGRRVDC